MIAVAVDTWAFLEIASEGPAASEVAAVLDSADFVFTTRDVVAETFNAIMRLQRSTTDGLEWLESLGSAGIVILHPEFTQIEAAMRATKKPGGLSFTDYSLAVAAKQEGTKSIATGDGEFRKLGLDPLFAKK